MTSFFIALWLFISCSEPFQDFSSIKTHETENKEGPSQFVRLTRSNRLILDQVVMSNNWQRQEGCDKYEAFKFLNRTYQNPFAFHNFKTVLNMVKSLYDLTFLNFQKSYERNVALQYKSSPIIETACISVWSSLRLKLWVIMMRLCYCEIIHHVFLQILTGTWIYRKSTGNRLFVPS